MLFRESIGKLYYSGIDFVKNFILLSAIEYKYRYILEWVRPWINFWDNFKLKVELKSKIVKCPFWF